MKFKHLILSLTTIVLLAGCGKQTSVKYTETSQLPEPRPTIDKEEAAKPVSSPDAGKWKLEQIEPDIDISKLLPLYFKSSSFIDNDTDEIVKDYESYQQLCEDYQEDFELDEDFFTANDIIFIPRTVPSSSISTYVSDINIDNPRHLIIKISSEVPDIQTDDTATNIIIIPVDKGLVESILVEEEE